MGNGPCCSGSVSTDLEEKTALRQEDYTAGGDDAPLSPKKEDEPEVLPNFLPPAAKEEPEPMQTTQEEPALAPVAKAEETGRPTPGADEQPVVVKLKLQERKWTEYTCSAGEMTAKEKEFLADKVSANSLAKRRPSTINTSLHDYAATHSAVFDNIRDWMKPDGWILKKTVDTVDIFTKSFPGNSNIFSKGTTTMKTYGNGIRHLASCLLTAEDRPKYDETVDFGETVESYLPHYRIVYFKMPAAAAIVAPRDILTLSRIRFEEDGTLVLATESTEHPDRPELSPYVRIQVVAGYVISPTSDPDAYQVSFVASADPGGWLPGWLKNLIAWKVQLVLAKFKKHYEAEYSRGKG